ncbi:Uncharacterized protein GBIM_09684 [Gryllus bimaculatus]|nr:Uncharacterized protein GBIM_09684 [Gryllus bimaculatus]
MRRHLRCAESALSGAERRRAMGAGEAGPAAAAAARLVLAAVLLHSLVQCAGANTENNARLTTSFGKPQQKPQESHPPKQIMGVQCSKYSDCDIANSSCIEDPRDGKKRCLCGDRSVPNGKPACKNRQRIAGFPCRDDADCLENAECILPGNISTNATEIRKIDVNKLLTGQNVKICWCRENFEITDDYHCSMGTSLLPSAVLILISLYALFMDETVQNIKY